MSTPQSTDILLVERNGITYKNAFSDMADILDGDLLLIQRGNTSYKCTGADYKAAVVPPNSAPDIASVAVSEDNTAGNRYTSSTYNVDLTMTDPGYPDSDKMLKPIVMGGVTQYGRTSNITNVSGPTLTFADANDINVGLFQPGDAVQQSNNSGITGNVATVDAVNNKMTLSSVVGTWTTGVQCVNTVQRVLSAKASTSAITNVVSNNFPGGTHSVYNETGNNELVFHWRSGKLPGRSNGYVFLADHGPTGRNATNRKTYVCYSADGKTVDSIDYTWNKSNLPDKHGASSNKAQGLHWEGTNRLFMHAGWTDGGHPANGQPAYWNAETKYSTDGGVTWSTASGMGGGGGGCIQIAESGGSGYGRVINHHYGYPSNTYLNYTSNYGASWSASAQAWASGANTGGSSADGSLFYIGNTSPWMSTNFRGIGSGTASGWGSGTSNWASVTGAGASWGGMVIHSNGTSIFRRSSDGQLYKSTDNWSSGSQISSNLPNGNVINALHTNEVAGYMWFRDSSSAPMEWWGTTDGTFSSSSPRWVGDFVDGQTFNGNCGSPMDSDGTGSMGYLSQGNVAALGTGAILTFSDSTGLSDFSVGDNLFSYWNQDLTWSDLCTGFTNPTYMFRQDGSTSNISITSGGSASTGTINVGGLLWNDRVEIYVRTLPSTTVLKAGYNDDTLDDFINLGITNTTTYSGYTGTSYWAMVMVKEGGGTLDKIEVSGQSASVNSTLQIGGVRVDGRWLIDPNPTAGTNYGPNYCTVKAINTSNSTMEVSDMGTFEVGGNVMGTSYVAAPTTQMYPVMSTSGTITDLTSVDPGYTTMSSNSVTQSITFPATFPSGQTPDNEMPAGTSITVDVKAQNSSGYDTHSSNTVTPT